MHAEYMTINKEVCEKIQETKERGGRVIAVGTTTVRVLESASLTGNIQPYQGETKIFIYPGFKFNCVDAMVTNFHLPESSLLMLVCAFAGYEQVMKAYQEAIEQSYRFFSYGDAMLITKSCEKE
jgi:S-adenosylmethionine:tRNA ribosyltransferase-isomerase